MIHTRVAWVLAVSLAVLAVPIVLYRMQREEAALEARLQGIRHRAAEREIPCAQVRAGRPLVLLALGQSNAGNSGAVGAPPLDPVTLLVDDRCILANDPLPGATGDGASIWRRLPDSLTRLGVARPVVLSVLAVDATSIDDWTRSSSALRRKLESQVAAMRALGLAPDLVLWQQGEADALAGTGAQAYAHSLGELQSALVEAGANAPVLLAYSTTCRSPVDTAIRSAIETTTADNPHFRLGPDTDVLQGARYRRDDCHFSVEGLNAAAKMWAERIKAQLPASALRSTLP